MLLHGPGRGHGLGSPRGLHGRAHPRLRLLLTAWLKDLAPTCSCSIFCRHCLQSRCQRRLRKRRSRRGFIMTMSMTMRTETRKGRGLGQGPWPLLRRGLGRLRRGPQIPQPLRVLRQRVLGASLSSPRLPQLPRRRLRRRPMPIH